MLRSVSCLLFCFLAIGSGHAFSMETKEVTRSAYDLAYTLGADQKCKVLSSDQHDVLKTFAARAEIVLTRTLPAGGAFRALEKAKKEGQHMPCNAETESLVRENFTQAEDAYQHVQTERKRGLTLERRRPMVSAPSFKRGEKYSNALDGYLRDLTLYLINQRCPVMSQREAWTFYRALNRKTVRLQDFYGKQALLNVQRRAQSIAQSHGACERARSLKDGSQESVLY